MPFDPVATGVGGEFSRVALALTVVAAANARLRRIDASIGGVTARRVAERCPPRTEHAQVVTDHAPAADRERRDAALPRREGSRDPTQTVIEELSTAERRTKLERMLGGEEFVTAIASEPEQ